MQGFDIECLVLDAAPLLSTAATPAGSALRGAANSFVTTPDVLAEIRDKTSRELFATTLQVMGLDNGEGETGGLLVKEPTPDAVAKVTTFARLTGDIAVLSQADIRVLALTYALEVERNGTRRLRDAPGKLSQEEQEREKKRQERLLQKKQKSEVEHATERLDGLHVEDNAKPTEAETSPTASTSQAPEESELQGAIQNEENIPEDSQEKAGEGEGSDSDGGEWITPSNVALHKSRDLGLFPALPDNPDHVLRDEKGKKVKQKTVLKVACLTGDFAMQNVALQMGLNVFGVGGKKIKEVKTWILRCHACYKLCKDPTKKFCPSCGNPSLMRTSITYVTPTPENPKGYILHLKANFQYHNRGTQYSIPTPKPGSSNALKNSANADLILREDQKEWVRSVRRAEIAKQKQEKAAAKAMKEGRTDAVFGGLSLDDPDWTPGLFLGESGRKGGPAGIRTGKDGLPIIGYGKRNPNAVRRTAK